MKRHKQLEIRKSQTSFSCIGKIGWQIKRQKGSHKTLSREDWADYVFAFHDGEEIGSKMMARIAKKTGLKPEDL